MSKEVNPIAVAQTRVVVAPLVQTAQIIFHPNQQLAATLNCDLELVQNLNIPENSNLLDLNRPANCFSLKISTTQPAVVNLQVKPLAHNIVKILVKNFTQFFAYNWTSYPSNPSFPLLPVSIFFAGVALATFEEKLLSLKLKNVLFTQNFSPTFQQLKILRC